MPNSAGRLSQQIAGNVYHIAIAIRTREDDYSKFHSKLGTEGLNN
jgi:hypothetical protein